MLSELLRDQAPARPGGPAPPRRRESGLPGARGRTNAGGPGRCARPHIRAPRTPER
ncbi:hypothetical protein NKH77_22610 [Streptomyces sp. M19]